MNGAEMRLGRLFDRQSGNAFVAAFDHGLTLRVSPENPVGVVERIVSTCEPEGVLLSPGMLKRTTHLFAHRGAPVPLVRCDFALLDDDLKASGESYRVICSPEEAASLGAGCAVMFLILGVEEGDLFAENAAAVAEAATASHRVGVPLMVEATLWGSRIDDKRDPELLAFACRIAAELGADVIKTEYTGSVETMRRVVEGCPVPILTLGGPKTDSGDALIEATRGAILAGARGVVYGRNIWQADDPRKVSSAVREAVHGVYAGR
ncbi:class I fructose-bisphosphate aldolase [Rubrobacter calidifluminis]|uniref:class I fructose-bisphosphate aldolase n=1 Tax=Rubrobacter calidifluminis TaxID=1392640 RepID=UPI00235F1520|nr:hypothetical protein [Rubrobacter calidifluminis]